MIAIVDYKVGNLGSVMNMFKKIDLPAEITSDPSVILKSDGVLFPGIGRFDFAMQALRQSDLIPVLTEFVFEKKRPLLGICVGYQMLTERSEEGDCPGLGWFSAEVKKFNPETMTNSDATLQSSIHASMQTAMPSLQGAHVLRVPHMGWNTIRVLQQGTPGADLLKFDDPECRFYFAHSYYVESKDPSVRLAQTQYGKIYDSALGNTNLFGVQFHPEKSHRFGMQLLRNFGNLVHAQKDKQ